LKSIIIDGEGIKGKEMVEIVNELSDIEEFSISFGE
jgi:hypothetical protein